MDARERSRSPWGGGGSVGQNFSWEMLAGMAAQMAGHSQAAAPSQPMPPPQLPPTAVSAVGSASPCAAQLGLPSASTTQACQSMQSLQFPGMSAALTGAGGVAVPGLAPPPASPLGVAQPDATSQQLLAMVTNNLMMNQQLLSMMGPGSAPPMQPLSPETLTSASALAALGQQAGPQALAAVRPVPNVPPVPPPVNGSALQAAQALLQPGVRPAFGAGAGGFPHDFRTFFIAVPLPESVKDGLHEGLKPIRTRAAISDAVNKSVKWIDLETAHISLRFLGRIPDAKVETLRQKLSLVAASFAPFKIELVSGGAVYDSKNQRSLGAMKIPEQLIVEVDEGIKELEKLRSAVESTCDLIGLPKEQLKSWKPYVNLGKVFQPIRCPPVEMIRLVGAIESLRIKPALVADVAQVQLVQSKQQPRNDEANPVFEPLATWDLEG